MYVCMHIQVHTNNDLDVDTDIDMDTDVNIDMDIDTEVDTTPDGPDTKMKKSQTEQKQKVSFSSDVNITKISSLRRHGVNIGKQRRQEKTPTMTREAVKDKARPTFTMVAKSKESITEQIKKEVFAW